MYESEVNFGLTASATKVTNAPGYSIPKTRSFKGSVKRRAERYLRPAKSQVDGGSTKTPIRTSTIADDRFSALNRFNQSVNFWPKKLDVLNPSESHVTKNINR
jgi:hypothetical protein